jgi:hypothetical protein
VGWGCSKITPTGRCGELRQAHPWCGSLEGVFAHQNQRYCGLFLDEWDFAPTYEDGRLVELRANKLDPDTLRAIQQSPQANDLRDLTIALPHLSEQTPEAYVETLLGSPLRLRLEVLQVGNADRAFEAPLDPWDLSELADLRPLVRLVEQMPQLRELYLGLSAEDVSNLLSARFSPQLRTLAISTQGRLDPMPIAENESLQGVRTLVLNQTDLGQPLDAQAQENLPALVGAKFHEHFRALANATALDHLKDLRIEMHEVDDTCCDILVASRVIRHLRRLYLRGQGITDAGAATLAASPEVKALEELYLGGAALTERGYAGLSAAGIGVQRTESW